MTRLARLLPIPLTCLVPGCGDDGSADGGGTSSSDPSASSSSTEPTTLEATSVDTTQTTLDPDTSGGSSATDASSGSTTGEPIEVDAEVITYDGQPMVADLTLTLSAPGTAVVTHASDAGVVISPQAGGDETHLRFRVRGLAPETTHTLQFDVTGDAGGSADGSTEFQTPVALPAFVGAFALDTVDVDPAPLYRLSDWNPFPVGDFAGALMVDTSGITRWYLSAPSDLAGPPAVWVGVKLRDDGTILYVVDDTFFIRDELGTILSEIPAVDLGLPTLHHDVHELPNGNFMALSQSFQEVDYVDLGTILVVGDVLVEFTPDGEVVWTWDTFDHLDPQRRRANFEDPIIDPTTGESGSDWTHANGFVYDADADTVTLSMRHQDWIINIDRATGDVLWRLGDGGDFELADGDRWFFHQHSPDWQPDGSLLLFDNGNGNPEIPDLEVDSRAARFTIDFDLMTAAVAWQDDEPLLQVPFAGDADLLPGGHLLVTDSSIFGPTGMYSRVREIAVGNDPERIWSMNTPDNHWIYRTTAHSRLVGQPLE